MKEFGKGFASGVKGAVKFAGKVKKVVSEEDAQEGKMYGYSGGGLVKKELKDLKKGAETLKGKNIAKADKIEEKNCGCGQTPCITYGKENKFNEAMSAYDKARKAAARRAADRNAARRRGEMGGRMERETYTSEGGTRMHHKGYKAREGE